MTGIEGQGGPGEEEKAQFAKIYFGEAVRISHRVRHLEVEAQVGRHTGDVYVRR